MNKDQQIAINFLPLIEQEFSFTIYRRTAKSNDLKSNEGLYHAKLPITGQASHDQEYSDYQVSLNSLPSYEEFTCNENTNRDLSLFFLANLLRENCRINLQPDKYGFNLGDFRKVTTFILESHTEGNEIILL